MQILFEVSSFFFNFGCVISRVCKMAEMSTAEKLKLFACFALWYLGNYYYNIYNKVALNEAGGKDGLFPITVALAQLVVAAMWAISSWALTINPITMQRQIMPKLSFSDCTSVGLVAAFSALAHLASVICMNAGSVAFGQIVKAAEPVFAALVNTIFYGKPPKMSQAMMLPIIVLGVAIACLKPDKDGNYKVEFEVVAVAAGSFANAMAGALQRGAAACHARALLSFRERGRRDTIWQAVAGGTRSGGAGRVVSAPMGAGRAAWLGRTESARATLPRADSLRARSRFRPPRPPRAPRSLPRLGERAADGRARPQGAHRLRRQPVRPRAGLWRHGSPPDRALHGGRAPAQVLPPLPDQQDVQLQLCAAVYRGMERRAAPRQWQLGARSRAVHLPSLPSLSPSAPSLAPRFPP